jgi:hypothetical protein
LIPTAHGLKTVAPAPFVSWATDTLFCREDRVSLIPELAYTFSYCGVQLSTSPRAGTLGKAYTPALVKL